MSYEKVKTTREPIIGTKQAIKALKSGNVAEVFVARDADVQVTDRIIELAKAKNVEVTLVPSRIELGKAYGIHVGAAAVAIIE